jgi:hypothetical protein
LFNQWLFKSTENETDGGPWVLIPK